MEEHRTGSGPTVSALIGKALWGWARATNMLMFQFGNRRTISGTRGKETQVGELALHVQCRWRIATNELVLVGSRDINYPAEYSEGDEIPEGFDWDRAATRLDKLIASLFLEHTFIVQDVKLARAGSLSATIGENLYLDLFPDDSLPSEQWRLFEPGRHQPHHVMAGRA